MFPLQDEIFVAAYISSIDIIFNNNVKFKQGTNTHGEIIL